MTREKGHGSEERRGKWKCSIGDAKVLRKVWRQGELG